MGKTKTNENFVLAKNSKETKKRKTEYYERKIA